MNERIFHSIVNKLKEAKDKDGNSLVMDSLMISQNSNVYRYNFKDEEELHGLRSISKPIVALALGMAMEKGLKLRGETLTLDTKIFPFFQDKVEITNKKNIEKLQKVTLRHVLTHTIGYADKFLSSSDVVGKDPFTFVDYVFNYDIIHEPGECFVYSNVGPYILSVLIQEELGLNLADWVNDILFSKIGITRFTWENYGKYCIGATGLSMSHEDVHKIGLILLNQGMFAGEQLVPKPWIEAMTSIQTLTPTMYDEKRALPKYGYGFYVYICKNGNYYIDGSDGQYLIVLPQKNILITTLGNQHDMKPITECFRELL